MAPMLDMQAGFKPRNPEQYSAQEALEDVHNDLVIMHGPAGCHEAGHPILMFDGTVKAVEDVQVGDQLMGPDSEPRNVLALARGREQMARITPTKGEPFVVNMGHILSLRRSYGSGPELVEVTVREWLSWSDCRKSRYKLWRTGYCTPDQDLPLHPYLIGALAGDGGLAHRAQFHNADAPVVAKVSGLLERYGYWLVPRKNGRDFGISGGIRKALEPLGLCCKSVDKVLPDVYMRGSLVQRAELLAGLLDTDGHYDGKGNYDFITGSFEMGRQVVQLARSLGLAAYGKRCTKGCQGGFSSEYLRVCISGDLEILPTVKVRPGSRKQIKRVSVTGFKVEPLDVGDYYGFALDGDHLYLDRYTMVHHNTGKTYQAICFGLDAIRRGVFDKILFVRPVVPVGRDIGFMPGTMEEKLSAWSGPVADAMTLLDWRHDPKAKVPCAVEMLSLPHVRGRSLANAFLIFDEAQNASPHEIKTVLSRASKGTRVALLGDTDQVDVPSLTNGRDGLTHAINRLDGRNHVAVIHMTKCERSRLSALAGRYL